MAGNAWFAINGVRVDDLALGLAGYAVLMVIVQLGLIPAYRTVPFGPGWWSFSFPYAATVGNAILWLAAEHVDRSAALDYLFLTLDHRVHRLPRRPDRHRSGQTLVPAAPDPGARR